MEITSTLLALAEEGGLSSMMIGVIAGVAVMLVVLKVRPGGK